MPSVKVNGTDVDLGELAVPLDFYPSKIAYDDQRSGSKFELRRMDDPRLSELKLLGALDKRTGVREPDRTAIVNWGDCSESVKAALKRKFRISSPPQSPTMAGPSSEASQSVAGPSAFSKEIIGLSKTIVKGLLVWDQSAARSAIETKLRSIAADERMTLLAFLNTQLSGKAAGERPAIIQNWASTATKAIAVAGRDMRTDGERELQDWLERHLSNPEFKDIHGQIMRMLPNSDRKVVNDISVHSDHKSFKSPLYIRLRADSRGALAAAKDIRDVFEPIPKELRYDALKQWQPVRTES